MTLENLQQALGENNKELIKRLSHENQDVLDKFSVDEAGNVLYNGEKIISDIKISEAANNNIIKKEDGIYVGQDKELADKVNTIKAYQRYTNAELEYAEFRFFDLRFDYGNIGTWDECKNKNMPVTLYKKHGNIDQPLLKANKKYYVSVNVAAEVWIVNEADISFSILINDKHVGGLRLQGKREYQLSQNTIHQNEFHTIIDSDVDCNIKIIAHCFSGDWAFQAEHCNLIIQEIAHDIVIDPLEYVNDQQGIEDCPVGHILSFMGNIPPKHYLMCDGSEYTISEYPYLAEHIRENFGSYNFFGGNGTTTFAVPDLRGEFLRGTGKNSHQVSGDGANVGIHQEGTKHTHAIGVLGKNNYIGVMTMRQYGNRKISSPDYQDDVSLVNELLYTGSNGEVKVTSQSLNDSIDVFGDEPYLFTSRPTNTSVMYCIKYEPTYYFHHTTNTTVNETKNITENITKEISSLDYLQTHADLEGVPVGHILSYMGNTAPKHYLKCDGTVYNISKYPLLAAHIKKEFGSYNYWGGNGSTTFAVPDLRGEFLRGAGTASRNTGTGTSVGSHQDATNHLNTMAYGSPQGYLFQTRQTSSGAGVTNPDKAIMSSNWTNYARANSGSDNGGMVTYTSRPTNTSVMWCIKYEPTYALAEKDEITDAELQQAILETIETLNRKENK